jgi:hypothetical protein
LPALPTIGWKPASNDAAIASYRFRVSMPATALSGLGYQAGPVDQLGIDHCDVVVFSKSYSPADLALARAVRKRGGRVIFDLCDNHFYNPFGLKKYEEAQVRIREMMSIANDTICTTDALSRAIADETGGAVTAMVVGDAAERLKFRRKAPAADGRRLELLWFGSHGSPNAPGGMEDLALIQDELTALSNRRAIRLTVCSNSEAKFQAVAGAMPFETCYVAWAPDSYAAAMKAADAVLIPINRNPFTDSKSHNRLTSALYAGLPVVATGIESYREFADYCVLDNWAGGLEALASDLPNRTALAIASRPYIDQNWSMKTLSHRWIQALDLPAPAAARPRRRAPEKVAETVQYQGRLDPVAAGAVTGWVRDIRRPGEPVIVDLEVDGERVASAVADILRPDLDAAGISPGNCGFSLASREIGRGHEQQITVRARPSGWIVGENPIITDGASAYPISEDNPTSELYRRQRSRSARAASTAQDDILNDFNRLESLFSQTRTLLMKSLITGGDSIDQLGGVRGLLNRPSAPPQRPTSRMAKAARATPLPARAANSPDRPAAKIVRPPDGDVT